MKLPSKRNQRGQATMEAILLMIVVACIAVRISTYAKNQGLLAGVVEGPWSQVRGMIEDGVWMNYTDSKPLHPNHLKRHQSRKGDST